MWKIYTGDKCNYCKHAKTLLNKQNIPFAEHNINMNKQDKDWLIDQGYKSVPQIWNHRGEHIGGFDQLKVYMEKTYWSDKSSKQKPIKPPTLDHVAIKGQE